MSIKKLQIEALIEQLNEEAMRLGVAVTTESIQELVKIFIESRPEGLPTFISPDVKRKSLFDVSAYNESMKSAETDIGVLYEFFAMSGKKQTDSMSFVQIERSRFIHALAELKLAADGFDSIDKAESPVDVISMDFRTRSNVITKQDFSDPVKECFVDVKGGALTLPINEKLSQNYDLEHMRYENVVPNINITQGEILINKQALPFANMFKQSTSGWQQDISLTKSATSLKASTDIRVSADGTVRPINFIRVAQYSNNPMSMSLEYSINGESFVPLHPRVNLGRDGYAFIFKEVNASVIRVTIHKDSPDDGNETENKFFIGLQRFEVGLNIYESEGDILLKGIGLDGKSILGISIVDSTSNSIDANIKYFISLDGEGKSNPSIEVIPQRDLSRLDESNAYKFSAYRTVEKDFVKGVKLIEGHHDFVPFFSMSIQDDPITISKYGYVIPERAKLRAGMDQWEVTDIEDLQKLQYDTATPGAEPWRHVDMTLTGTPQKILVPRSEDALIQKIPGSSSTALRATLPPSSTLAVSIIEESYVDGILNKYDRSSEIDRVEGNFILLSESSVWGPNSNYRVSYHGEISEDISISKSSISIVDMDGNPVAFPSEVDIDFKTWEARSVTGDTIKVRIGFEYLLDVKILRQYSAYALIEGSAPGEVVFDRLDCSTSLGERVIISSEGNVQDISNGNKADLSSVGWYKITVISKVWSDGISSAMNSVNKSMLAGSGTPDYAFRSGTGLFSVVSRTKDELTYVPPSQLYKTRMDDLSKFSISQVGSEFKFIMKHTLEHQVFTVDGDPANEKFNFRLDYLEKDVVETDKYKSLFMKIKIEKKSGTQMDPTYSPAVRKLLLRLEYA